MGKYTEGMIRGIVGVGCRLAGIVTAQPAMKATKLSNGGVSQTFDLVMDTETVGYCARLVRQVVEVGCQFGEHTWALAGGTALETCKNLKAAGYKLGSINDREPGCIVGINRNAGDYGHVALYLGRVDGVDCILENTSDGKRGRPQRAGTKVTPWSAISDRVTGVYRLGRYVAAQAKPEPAPTWNFRAQLEGADVVARNVWATQFDDHETRTGIPADDTDVIGCSLPRGLCDATEGSPWASYAIPDYTQVRVYCGATKKTIVAVVIDEGPAWGAQAGTGKRGSAAIDLSVGAANALGLAPGQNAQVDVRVLGRTAVVGRAAAIEWAS